MLNLNVFRNTHYRTLNVLKQNYHQLVLSMLTETSQRFVLPVRLTYDLWLPDKRRRDIANILCIVDKFTCDALVEACVLKDDNYLYVPEILYRFGGIDKENPRADLSIKEIV